MTHDYFAGDPRTHHERMRGVAHAYHRASVAGDDGAVVTRGLPANVVAVGNPARVVRDITEG